MKSKLIDCLIVTILLLAVIAIPSHKDNMEQVVKIMDKPVVVIDPGHGRMDGGAVAADGTCEKNINLSISLLLKEKLENEGIRVIMTRTEDKGLYEESQKGSVRTLKTADMQARKDKIDDSAADLTVSIHLNSFSQDASVMGAQVFYPAEGDECIVADSCCLAEIIQNGLNNDVNYEKERSALSKGDIFIFREAKSAIVIVECGFLSNDKDLNNLKNGNYQEKISKSLKGSICKYLKENGKYSQ